MGLPNRDIVHQNTTPFPTIKLRRPGERLDEWVVAGSAATAGNWFLVDAIVSILSKFRNQHSSFQSMQ